MSSLLPRSRRIISIPFDRMLVAQAQAHSLVIVTVDSDIPKYDVTILWR
jgi:PIN domain nuclease of toxin-antitoxin system